MENCTPNTPNDVELLASILLQKKNTTSRFNLPMTHDQAMASMKAAVIADVKSRKASFVENENLSHQLSLMAEWLTTQDQRFFLLIMGKCGNGKTTFIRALQNLLNLRAVLDKNDKIGYGIIDAREIAWMCRDSHEKWFSLANRPMLAIDDLGTEPAEILEYGNRHTPLTDLLYKRYDKQLFTIITTNLTPKDIRERYGERIADRLNEIAFCIVFDNDSYRKPK